MKKVLSVLLCMALILSILALSGCQKAPNLSGTELAKMLLANQRLDPEDLSLGLETALTGSATGKSANKLYTPGSGEPVLSLLSSSQSGDTVQWKDFTDESNTYAFFQSYFVNIEHTASSFAAEIAKVKETCGNTNYWMKRSGTSEKFLLMVTANADIIFIADKDSLQICRRYTNENADDVYDMYSRSLDGSYEERCLYIAGKRYEFSSNFGGYEGLYIVAENSRGFWNMFQVLDIEPGRANVMNFVSNGSYAYTFDASIIPDMPQSSPAIQFSTADLTNDVLTYGDGMADLNISAFRGVDHVESNISNVDMLEDGSNALTSQIGTLVTTSGNRISTYDTLANGNVDVNGMTTSYIKNAYGPGSDSTTGNISLRLSGETMAEQVANLKQFLSEAGLTCRYDLDGVLSGLSQAKSYAANFTASYKWNGNAVNSYAGIQNAVDTEKAKYAEFNALYDQVKDMKTVGVNAFGKSFEGVDFSQIAAISGTRVTLSNNTISVEDLSVTVTDTALFDNGGQYTVCLALAKFEDGNQSNYENAVMLSCVDADNTTFTGGEFTLKQTATFEIPKCTSGGQYTIVAYVATQDGIRVSHMVPLVFTEDISQEATYDGISATFATNANRELLITCTVTDVYKKEDLSADSTAEKASVTPGKLL